jgi:hypothetical protein
MRLRSCPLLLELGWTEDESYQRDSAWGGIVTESGMMRKKRGEEDSTRLTQGSRKSLQQEEQLGEQQTSTEAPAQRVGKR